MREFTLGYLDESRSVPGGSQLVGQAAAWPWVRHWYYYSTIRLILIYRPSEGGRLSRPRHCSECAARAQICVSRWFSVKNTETFVRRSAIRSWDLSRCSQSCFTRPLRPAARGCSGAVAWSETDALFPPSRIRCRIHFRSKAGKNYVHPWVFRKNSVAYVKNDVIRFRKFAVVVHPFI